MYGFPDIQGFYDMLYGTAGVDFQSFTCMQVGNASAQVFQGNPPFTITDFIGIYAKFAGPPTQFSGLTLTADSQTVTGFTSTTGLSVGQLVVNLNSITKDTTITSVGSDSVTLSNPALADDTVMTVYESPFVPLVVISTYIALAQASVMSNRYNEAWFICMCYFVAHYCTLFLRTEAGEQNYTVYQAASSGLTKGIVITRQAGDVSATSKLIEGYEEWGAWAETQYGELFITMARAICAGPMYVS